MKKKSFDKATAYNKAMFRQQERNSQTYEKSRLSATD